MCQEASARGPKKQKSHLLAAACDAKFRPAKWELQRQTKIWMTTAKDLTIWNGMPTMSTKSRIATRGKLKPMQRGGQNSTLDLLKSKLEPKWFRVFRLFGTMPSEAPLFPLDRIAIA